MARRARVTARILPENLADFNSDRPASAPALQEWPVS
jgi:hypothetical protein